MLKPLGLLAGCLVALPGAALAQSYDDPGFGGVKIGAAIDYRSLDGDYALPRIESRIEDDRGGIGFRGFLGYDAQLGDALVIGGEAGLGRGGKSLDAQSATGDYSLKPRWSWDVSGRAGILPAPNVLIYGRAGYSWLRVRETTDFNAASLEDISVDATEKGFLWGAGVETRTSSGLFARGEYNRTNYGAGLTASKIQFGIGMGF